MALCVWIMDTNVSDNKGNLCTDMSPNERRKIIKLKMINELFIRSVCALHTRVYIIKIIKNIQYEAVSISVVSIDIIQQPIALIVTRKQRCRNGMMKEVSIWFISCENRINVVHPKISVLESICEKWTKK